MTEYLEDCHGQHLAIQGPEENRTQVYSCPIQLYGKLGMDLRLDEEQN